MEQKFLGLTGKVKIKDIYDGRYLDDFDANLTEEERQKYEENQRILVNGFNKVIQDNSYIPNKKIIPGVDLYEKEYPEDIDLFADKGSKEENLAEEEFNLLDA